MTKIGRSGVARVLLGLLTAALAISPGSTVRAQPTRPAVSIGRGLIVGQVLDAVTGKPLRDAIVSITSAVAARDEGAPASRILTTADGYFVFRDLGRGSFLVRAIKAGFTDGASGRRRAGGPSQPIVLADGQRVGNVTVRMWRTGALSGMITDEAGEPLVSIRVRAFRRTIGSGRPRFLPASTAVTDDRGQYRLGGLLPGDYLVGVPARQVIVADTMMQEISAGRRKPPRELMADLSANAKEIRSGGSVVMLDGTPVPPPASGERLFVYPPSFQPTIQARGLTVPLTIAGGEEREGIDLQLQPVLTRRVSGLVVGPAGATAGMAVWLWPEGFDDVGLEQDATTAISDASGAFVFPAVPTGHYSLRASSGEVVAHGSGRAPRPARWADEPVAVGTTDVAGVVVTLKDALSVRGRIELDGGSARAPAVSFQQVALLAQSVDGAPVLAGGPAATVGGNGEFTLSGLSPGRYFVRPGGVPAGWVLKSAMYDGRDLSETPVDLQSDVDGLVVTLTDRWTSLRGVVRLPQGQADEGAIVIAFSTDLQSWTDFGPSPRRVRSTPTAKTGEYSIAGLPPGDYYVVALPDSLAGEWRDDAVLRALARVASQVSIRDGEPKTQDLRTRLTW